MFVLTYSEPYDKVWARNAHARLSVLWCDKLRGVFRKF